MELSFGGIKDLKTKPGAIFIVDTKKELLAVNEALKLNIPIIGIVDTNADPTVVKYPIPANDDAIRAIKLICSVMANAVESGTAKHIAWKQEQDAIKAKEEEEARKVEAEKEKQDELAAKEAEKTKAEENAQKKPVKSSKADEKKKVTSQIDSKPAAKIQKPKVEQNKTPSTAKDKKTATAKKTGSKSEEK